MIPAGPVVFTRALSAAAWAQDPSWLDQGPPSLWSSERRDAGFRQMHRIYKTNTVPAGGKAHAFGAGKALALSADVGDHMETQRTSGLLIIQNDKIRLERYARGFDARGRWTSMSAGKSVASTLIGAAIKDGYIRSLDDKVTRYVQRPPRHAV